METKATPRPWHFVTVPTQIGHAHKIEPIGACLYVDQRDANGLDEKTVTARANAALIVRAVNSHATLAEALERSIKAMQSAWYELEPGPGAIGDQFIKRDDMTSRIDQARAALAKAGL